MAQKSYEEDNEDFTADAFSKYRKQKVEDEKRARVESGAAPEDDDEEVQVVWGQVRRVQQDSLTSTRNTLSKLRETQDIGANTLNTLYKQGDQLGKVERNIEKASENAIDAENQADDLHKYDGLIPVNFNNVFSRKKKKREQEQKAQSEAAKTSPRTARRATNLQMSADDSPAAKAVTAAEPIEDEVEQEIDENLNEISAALSNLKDIGLSMNTELDVHKEQITHISNTADNVSTTIKSSEKKIKKFL
jgi:hypothetical protein